MPLLKLVIVLKLLWLLVSMLLLELRFESAADAA
jgi:hypothetical protein